MAQVILRLFYFIPIRKMIKPIAINGNSARTYGLTTIHTVFASEITL